MFTRNVVTDFKPNKDGLKKVFGDLEAEIMEVIWQEGEVTVRRIYEKILQTRDIAYTTVMTVVTRLANKGILEKKKEKNGNAYVYCSLLSREQLTDFMVSQVLDSLLKDFCDLTILHFREKIKNIDDNIK